MLNIIVLAAGQGKRMCSDLPKVLHAIGGRPMLGHVLASARELAPARLIVVVGHGAAQVRTAMAAPDIEFVVQEKQSGTAHAVLQAMPGLGAANDDEACLVLYGDVPLIRAGTLRNLLQVRGNGLALLTQQLEDPSGYGRIVRDDDGRILRIVEQKDTSTAEQAIQEINTGILAASVGDLRRWLARVDNRNSQKEYYLTDIVGMAVADGVPLISVEPGSGWETMGVNSRHQQATLERIWQREQATGLLDAGVTLADPARIDIRGALHCGRDVHIDVGCIFEGEVSLADGVRIGPYCVLRDSSIGTGTEVHAFSHLEGARVENDARIGPFARLRPGTQLAAEAHVGNFVELKKTRLGRSSKASHLSYLGDAIIGERVNIGAGTITCNYDGANKFETVIEDGVFIGSDTQLVAPVRVGHDATIGAGTTLTRDAPAGELTLSRSRQQTVNGWKRPEPKT